MTTPLWKRLLAHLQAALTATAFAEEGELETARRIATRREPSSMEREKAP